jgi:selenocysteine-specific translation elongation factor
MFVYYSKNNHENYTLLDNFFSVFKKCDTKKSYKRNLTKKNKKKKAMDIHVGTKPLNCKIEPIFVQY